MEPQEFGPYSLVEQIAVGGMAQIYLAKIRGIAGFEKYLALKLLHPSYADDDQFIEMLIEEAKIAVRLNHVNIGQVFDLGHHDDRYYISMEYIDGPDLFKMMRRLTERDIDVPIDVATYIAQELCTGLDYAHRKLDEHGKPLSIIHRDISPQNVLISVAGEVKLVDFGIAKATSRSMSTQAGVIKGKYFYMSPEQAWGDPIDQRSDIFSAGVILYEVLTGQMLYLEEDMQRLLDMVRKADIEPPSNKRREIPGELEQIVMKALCKNREDRWPTAQDFQLALTNFLFSYAADFTPDRLARLVDRALEEVDEAEEEETHGARSFISHLPALEATEQGNDRAPARDGKVSTQQVELDALMSRDDYRADQEASVIFRLDQLVDGDDDDEADRGEMTVVSGPPAEMAGREMLGRSAPRGVGEATLGEDPPTELDEGDWEEVPGDPTVLTRLPEASPSRSDSLPEVIVPSSSREEPTLVEERHDSAHRMRPQPSRTPPPPPLGGHKSPPRRVSLPEAPPVQWAPSWPPVAQPSDGGDSTARQARSAPVVAPGPPTGSAPNWPPIARPMPTQDGDDTNPAGIEAPAGVFSPAFPGGTPPAGSAGASSQLAQRAAATSGQPAPSQPPLGNAAGQATSGWPPAQRDAGEQGVWQGGGLAGETFGMELDLDGEWPSAEARARRRRRLILVMSGAAVVVALLGVVVFFLTSGIEKQPATIEVISVPLGAEVWLDGKKVPKRTKVSIPVADPAIPHRLEVKLANYEPWIEDEIRFAEGQQLVRALAVLNPIYGKLQVGSKPTGADVYLNGELRGRTPTVVEGLTLSEEVSLELRKRGYRPETKTITWEGNRDRKVMVTLKRSR